MKYYLILSRGFSKTLSRMRMIKQRSDDMTLGEIIENVCELCAAEGYPYNEETCKDCEYNPNNKHETTTFEPQNEDSRGYADIFRCTYCGCDVVKTYHIRVAQFDYNYCPYCGRPVKSEVQDGDK